MLLNCLKERSKFLLSYWGMVRQRKRILFDRIDHIKLNLGENILKADTAAILALSKVKGSFYD